MENEVEEEPRRGLPYGVLLALLLCIGLAWLAWAQHRQLLAARETAQRIGTMAEQQRETYIHEDEARARQIAELTREVDQLRRQLAERPAVAASAEHGGDTLFHDGFDGPGLDAYRLDKATAEQYIGIEDHQLVIGQRGRFR
jgi:hypothetical protein